MLSVSIHYFVCLPIKQHTANNTHHPPWNCIKILGIPLDHVQEEHGGHISRMVCYEKKPGDLKQNKTYCVEEPAGIR